jgi:hypothetical protein
MSQYAALLRQGATEVREFQRSAEANSFGTVWLESLAMRLEAASSVVDPLAIEREIKAIARSITDSGPTSNNFSPSFAKALDALQRAEKRRRG